VAEVLYLVGRDAPMPAIAFGWSLLLNGMWALFWVAGNSGGDR
jgi:hypothetical protein